MPKSEALQAYYGGYYDTQTVDGRAKSEGRVTIGGAARMGRHLAHCLGSTKGARSVSILDFGGGDGLLSVLAAEEFLAANLDLRNVSVTVVDYNTQMHQPTNPAIRVQGFAQLNQVSQDNHDFVIASAIVEHIPDCAGVLHSLLAHVAPGGSLYLRTPFAAPFMRVAEKLGKSWDFTFPAHLHDLGQRFWERYFTSDELEQKFEIKSSRPSIVQASISERPVEAVVSHFFKLPWLLLGRSWPFVGGWEITVARK